MMDPAAMFQYERKVKTVEELCKLIGPRPRARKVIMCHGVFDIVHPGHVRHLIYAKSKGDVLVVSVGRPGIELKPEPVKVVGNLPFYITSDIVLRLFKFAKYFESIVIMVQREVADRIAAEPGGREYGVLSATAQLHARVEKLFTVPPGAFSPPPKVFSTVLRLTMDPQQQRLGVVGDGFIDFIRLSFGQKRKTLWNNLKGNYDNGQLKRALATAKVKPTARAETLSLDQSAAIFRALREQQAES